MTNRPVRTAALCIALAGALWSASAEARDPSYASYSADNDRLFWFIHITDTHVGWPVTGGGNLKLVADKGYKVVKPRFIAITGDLTDMGFMTGYWNNYRSILTAAGHTPKTIFDQPGNHDRWLDSGLSNYKKHSIQGKATGATHHAWTLQLPFGDYHFVGLDTSSGSLSSSEQSWALTQLKAGAAARQSIVMGHHPMSTIDSSGAFRQQLAKEGALAYLFGHTHKASAAARSWTKDKLLLWITQTLGKPLSTLGEAEYTVVALDNDGLSVRPFDLGFNGASGYHLKWPAVQITTPLDLGLGGTNPYAYPASSAAKDNPIRALVFSDTAPSQVTASVDKSPPFGLTQVNPGGALWEGTFDGQLLGSGATHTLSVTATAGGDSDTHSITFEASATTACSDTLDNDGDKLVDYPADPGCSGLFDSDERDPPALVVIPDAGAGDAGVGDAMGDAFDAGSHEAGGDQGPDIAVSDAGAPDAATADLVVSADVTVVPDSGADGTAQIPPAQDGCSCSAAVGGDDLGVWLVLALLTLVWRRPRRTA